MNRSGCSTLLKATFRVLVVMNNRMLSGLLNSLIPEHQLVNFQFNNISAIYMIKIRNKLQVVYFLVRIIPDFLYIYVLNVYLYAYKNVYLC